MYFIARMQKKIKHIQSRHDSTEYQSRKQLWNLSSSTLSFYKWPWTAQVTCMHVRSVGQSCPTLCDPMDCNPLGSSIHGIFQASILEWVAISFSKGLNLHLLCLLHWQANSLPRRHLRGHAQMTYSWSYFQLVAEPEFYVIQVSSLLSYFVFLCP